MAFSGAFDEKEVISVVKEELQKLGLFLKNRKTAIINNTKRQTVTGIVVNEKVNLTKEYKKKIRQEVYYIKRFGIDSHLMKIGILEKKQYIDSLLGRIAFVLQTIPKDDEFLEYKNLLQTYIKGELNP